MNGLGTTLGQILNGGPQPVARQLDPTTSHQAATDTKKRLAGQRVTVLANLYGAFTTGQIGCTDFEHEPIQQTSAGKRRGELQAMGLVEDSGQRRVTPSGSKSIVWRITPTGIGAWHAIHLHPELDRRPAA